MADGRWQIESQTPTSTRTPPYPYPHIVGVSREAPHQNLVPARPPIRGLCRLDVLSGRFGLSEHNSSGDRRVWVAMVLMALSPRQPHTTCQYMSSPQPISRLRVHIPQATRTLLQMTSRSIRTCWLHNSTSHNRARHFSLYHDLCHLPSNGTLCLLWGARLHRALHLDQHHSTPEFPCRRNNHKEQSARLSVESESVLWASGRPVLFQ